MNYHAITDIEIIGNTLLVVCMIHETGQVKHFWFEDRPQFLKFYRMKNVTFVGFNSSGFDAPIIQAFVDGAPESQLKKIANTIIEESLLPWQTLKRFDISKITADWIDLKEPAPGVQLSLKTYEGRMHFPTIADMPIDHNADISDSPRLKQTVLEYCINDVKATDELFRTIRSEIDLRSTMSDTYGIDLRSKSGAQAAEAILRSVCGIERQEIKPPAFVTYKTPEFVKTDNPLILDLIERIESHRFIINPNNGSPEFPEFLKTPITLNQGVYQFGIGGLHSQHDVAMRLVASDDMHMADWDVASYYPTLLIAAGLVPKLPNNKGEVFLETYRGIFRQRISAKRNGDKATANSLKLVLNSTFGKLGNRFCSFYAPDLMLAVTITGQLNLLCLIDRLERIEGVLCRSANTDGILVTYPPNKADQIKAVIAADSTFEYEETLYREIAYRDVNSYLAVTTDGKVKRKGTFSKAGVIEGTNPTFQICADAAAQYLLDRTPPAQTIRACEDIRQFVAIRNITGGGTQHIMSKEVDDWVLEVDVGTKDNVWHSPSSDKRVKRKSRPQPFVIGVGGKPIGRVARWYRSTKNYQPITYLSTGNKVPDSEKARLVLTLPKTFPSDIDYA